MRGRGAAFQGERLQQELETVDRQSRLRTTLDRMNLGISTGVRMDPVEQRRLVSSDLLFASVLREASDAIVSMDVQGIVQSWNQGAERLFGIPESHAVSSNFASLFEEPELVLALLHRARRGQSSKHEIAVRVGPDLKTVEAAIDGIRDERGGTIGIVGILRDVTVARQTEQALRGASRQKDEFLAMLAHELRNPLSPIKTASQILRLLDDGSDERVRRASSIIARQVERLSGLVEDLLDVARVTRGVIVLDKRKVRLHEIIAAAVEQAHSLVDAKHQTLRVTARSDVVVLAEPERLIQVMANLLNNAAKYTQEGGWIRLQADVRGEDVEIRVSDNGMGIPRDLLPRVFELFSQGDRAADRSQGGLGIGLALVKTLVQLHGGWVRADSAGDQQGSTFVVTLPRLVHVALPSETLGTTGALAFPAGNRLHLMVVDDNRDAALTLAELLQVHGHTVASGRAWTLENPERRRGLTSAAPALTWPGSQG